MEAQRELGVDIPAEAIDDYRAVVDTVDLDSIEAGERRNRHDVKARIEEFSALAGHEHAHMGMTSRDLTENVEQLQVRLALELVRDRMVAALARLAERAGEYATLVMAGRSHNVPAQATTLGKRFANAGEELLAAYRRVDDLIGPLTRCGGSRVRSVPSRTSSTCWTATPNGSTAWSGPSSTTSASPTASPTSARSTPVARLRRRVRPGAGHCGTGQPGHHHPAHGRPGAGDRGLRPRPGGQLRHAAQDEHPLGRAGQRPGRGGAGLPVDDVRAGGRPVERGRRVVLGGPPGGAARARSSPPTACSRPSCRCSTASVPTPR